ncbi:EamA-like transporter family protein [Plasticicumulans lactativorans]|uniref:EamA-like transporter family protein n=1 Tax=Plasticicumulans lactativorans TaxID=1133106 RepID=A0A4R2L665_9GAMM|nr:EamA family transporter [Plasticicumulans lactativorans]TCO78138.1 EamA-like transporter family protein [Plasticicumulans lactativorans]
MTWQVFGLIVLSVSISALAQIVLKLGVSTPLDPLVRNAGRLTQAWAVISNGYVLLGFLLYGLGALVWLAVLSRVDVSQAYPFVGLGFILTLVLGALVLGEAVGPTRWAGALLVMAGIACLARS